MNNPDLVGLQDSINLTSHYPKHLNRIFSFSRHYHDDIVGGKYDEGNDYMLIIGAFCHLSLVEFYTDGGEFYWGLNGLGHRIAMIGGGLDRTEILRRFPFKTEDIVWAKRKDWLTLQDPSHRAIFAELVKRPCGVKEQEFSSFGNKQTVLETVAAAISLGAGWMTGYDFSPTLEGSFMALSPNSPLNKPIP